jgi:hypothetical protein
MSYGPMLSQVFASGWDNPTTNAMPPQGRLRHHRRRGSNGSKVSLESGSSGGGGGGGNEYAGAELDPRAAAAARRARGGMHQRSTTLDARSFERLHGGNPLGLDRPPGLASLPREGTPAAARDGEGAHRGAMLTRSRKGACVCVCVCVCVPPHQMTLTWPLPCPIFTPQARNSRKEPKVSRGIVSLWSC